MPINEEHKENRTEEINELLKRKLVRKGVTTLARIVGVEKVLGESGDVDILDVLDNADLGESDK